jgi:hypothetical protein
MKGAFAWCRKEGMNVDKVVVEVDVVAAVRWTESPPDAIERML